MIDEAFSRGFDIGYEKGKAEGRENTIDEVFSEIQQKLHDDTTINIDIPVEEVLGEEVDVEDFLMLAEEIVQQYKNLFFAKLREAKAIVKGEYINEYTK